MTNDAEKEEKSTEAEEKGSSGGFWVKNIWSRSKHDKTVKSLIAAQQRYRRKQGLNFSALLSLVLNSILTVTIMSSLFFTPQFNIWFSYVLEIHFDVLRYFKHT